MKRDQDERLIYEALSQVETPEYDILTALERARQRPKRPWVRSAARRVIVLAAVCAVLAVSAGAVGASGLWSAFFGPIPSNAISTVGVSQTAGEYTLTLEDAIVDENGAMLLLALTRAGGGEIDPNASLRTNTLRARLLLDDKPLGNGYFGFEEPQLSADGTTLYFCYEARTGGMDANPLGKTLTFTADGVGVQLYAPDKYDAIPREVPVRLAALSQAPDYSQVELRDRSQLEALLQAVAGQEIQIPLSDEAFPRFYLLGAVMTENGLSIVVTQDNCRSGDLIANGVNFGALTDTRDGTRYEIGGGYGAQLPDGTFASLTWWRDCPLGPEDLPYLEAEISYSLDRLLSEEPFSLTFRADKSSAVTLPVEEPVTISGVELHPTEIRLSALSLLVFFDDMDTARALNETGSAPVLTLKDGSVIETQWSGSYGGADGRCSIRFRVEDSGQERFFFDTSQISSIRFGSLEIPIP